MSGATERERRGCSGAAAPSDRGSADAGRGPDGPEPPAGRRPTRDRATDIDVDAGAASAVRTVHPDAVVPPTGQATAAGGGYGVGSGRASSGGSGDAGEDSVPAGTDPETEWLRSETTGEGR